MQNDLKIREPRRTAMRGERDGNVGDWAFSVRLANSGNWARLVAEPVSRYRVQKGSVTSSGRGVDAHRAFELARELRVPAEFEKARAKRLYRHMLVVASRYVRDGAARVPAFGAPCQAPTLAMAGEIR